MTTKATAEARPNIALIKYWGRADHELNLPLTDSISMTMGGLTTRTTVVADPTLKADEVVINGVPQTGAPHERVVRHLDHLRKRAGVTTRCRVVSENSFPSSAGLASSASAFAALTVAGFAALGAEVSATEASAYARLGSGSAARSIYGGFVRWKAATTHEESVAEPIAPADHLDLHDVVAVFSKAEKKVGSAEGHGLADTSPLLEGRLTRVPQLLREVEAGIRSKDIHALGRAAEEDAVLMHAVMMTSQPPLLYWTGETVETLHAVRRWREEGLATYATIDAGPNVHLLCLRKDAAEVARRAREELGASEALVCGPGEGTTLVSRHLA